MNLKKFFEDHPALKRTTIAKEAGISNRMIDYIINGQFPLSEKIEKKLKPILKKYGCKDC